MKKNVELFVLMWFYCNNPFFLKIRDLCETKKLEGFFFNDNDNELFPGHIYSVDVETTNADVPYGDTFFVLSHYCLVKVVFVYTLDK